MGKSQSKGEAPKEQPKEPAEKDTRWELSRMRTAKWDEYFAKKQEIIKRESTRPIGNSTYWRELPMYQAWWFHLGLITFFFRKLPFANPFARVFMLLFGVDLCRSRTVFVTVSSWESRKYYRQFTLMNRMMTRDCELRLPDYDEEHEHWYMMNKPAYRVPVPWEFTLDAYMRYYLINSRKYCQRPVEWEGEWEQEISLNMDLFAPHTDHWLSVH